AANTLGTVKVTGFTQPEKPSVSFVAGDVTAGIITAAGGGAGVPGVAALSVAGKIQATIQASEVMAPFGIKKLTVGGSVGGAQIGADNPATPTAGALSSVTVGELANSTVRAGSIGTLKVTANVAAGLLGQFQQSTVAVTSTAVGPTGPQAIGSLSVAADVRDGVLDAPGTVGAITVGGRITFFSSSGSRLQAGYNSGSKLGTLTAGAWGEAGFPVTTALVTRAVGTFALTGNA